jgi:uncharacterized membrane protein
MDSSGAHLRDGSVTADLAEKRDRMASRRTIQVIRIGASIYIGVVMRLARSVAIPERRRNAATILE